MNYKTFKIMQEHIYREKCSNLTRYKGMRRPACGCFHCWKKYFSLND